jgi:hypothetical protein
MYELHDLLQRDANTLDMAAAQANDFTMLLLV